MTRDAPDSTGPSAEAPVGIHWLDSGGTILEVNQAELDLLGYSHAEYVGRPITAFLVEPQPVLDMLRRLQRGDAPGSCEARLRCRNGSIRIVRVSCQVVRKEGPRLQAACFVQEEPAALTQLPQSARSTEPRLRILIVEDNRDAAISLKILLELYGHEVQVAYTGPEGVQKAHEAPPDVVVCDIGLPGLDGYGVARHLRSHPDTANARLIAVTGYGGEEDRRRSLESGFDYHLTKPADPDQLRQLLRRKS